MMVLMILAVVHARACALVCVCPRVYQCVSVMTWKQSELTILFNKKKKLQLCTPPTVSDDSLRKVSSLVISHFNP